MLVFDRELLKYKRIRDHLDGKVIFVWFSKLRLDFPAKD